MKQRLHSKLNQVLKALVLSNFTIQLYAIVTWIYSFNQFPTHTERVSYYLTFWLGLNSVSQINGLLVAIGLITAFILVKYDLFRKSIQVTLFIFQVVFLLWIGWSYL